MKEYPSAFFWLDGKNLQLFSLKEHANSLLQLC